MPASARWSREDSDAAELVEAIVAPRTVHAMPAGRRIARPVPRLTSPAVCPGSA